MSDLEAKFPIEFLYKKKLKRCLIKMTKILYAKYWNFTKLNINKTTAKKKNEIKMLKVSYFNITLCSIFFFMILLPFLLQSYITLVNISIDPAFLFLEGTNHI
jgi:hypothetical protein